MNSGGIKKLYYSIGEVSRLTDLDPHVLRYWETEFEQLKPGKNRGGRRIYTENDIAVIQRIQHLLRDRKFTIEGARRVLEAGEDDPQVRREETREKLIALRTFLVALLEQLEGKE